MPIFEYVCEDCGTKFEKLVRNGVTVQCPKCGQEHLKQQFSTFAAKADGRAPEPQMGGCGARMCGSPGFCNRN